jgi:hypothetical protein
VQGLVGRVFRFYAPKLLPTHNFIFMQYPLPL